MTVQSAVLKSFYINIQTWIDTGCPPHPVFKKEKALCINLMYFLREFGANQHMRSTVDREILSQFDAAGLHKTFPFCSDGTINEYINEQALGDHYQNPKRLAWVKQHAEEEPHV